MRLIKLFSSFFYLNIFLLKVDDCWFLSGVTAIAQNKHFFNNVVPGDQSFLHGSYYGAFYFRFWRFGEWLSVIVDDFLPVDTNGSILYCRNKVDKNEFWSCLLEKVKKFISIYSVILRKIYF